MREVSIMSVEFVILAMIFCHILDDFVLQPLGVLSNMKQRSWWEENAPDKKYECDHLIALLMHGLSWAFMVMLPIAVYYRVYVGFDFVACFIIHALLHSIIDDMKANARLINLCVDQGLHMAQIVWIFFTLL